MRFTYSQTESLNLSAGKWSEFSCIPFPRTFHELLHCARTHTALEATESLIHACRVVQTRDSVAKSTAYTDAVCIKHRALYVRRSTVPTCTRTVHCYGLIPWIQYLSSTPHPVHKVNDSARVIAHHKPTHIQPATNMYIHTRFHVPGRAVHCTIRKTTTSSSFIQLLDLEKFIVFISGS